MTDITDRVWWLRTSVAAVLFAILFGYMSYTDPSLFTAFATGMNVTVAIWMVVMYFIWPKSPEGTANAG